MRPTPYSVARGAMTLFGAQAAGLFQRSAGTTLAVPFPCSPSKTGATKATAGKTLAILPRRSAHSIGRRISSFPLSEKAFQRARRVQGHGTATTSRRGFTIASAPADGVNWNIEIVPCLKDNYAYLIANPGTGTAAVVDPSEASPVIEALERLGLKLSHILCTHHHWDHTGGNLDLKAKYGAKVVGPAEDRHRIPGIDIALKDGDVWDLEGLEVQVLHTPGHTTGHCSFFLPQLTSVFTGDTLFSLGCGRLFEGSPAQMWDSLSRLAALPPDSKIYCGHEYTLSNAKFAVALEPRNEALHERVKEIQQLRSRGLPTIPAVLEVELATNPFLRPHATGIRSSLKLAAGASDVDVFAVVRHAKDGF